jgi:hypothetical protein
MNDKPDYLEREQQLARIRLGRELEDHELSEQFAKLDPHDRATILQTIDSDSGEISSENTDMRKHARKMTTVRALHATNATLRRLGR